jgi:ABC-type polysaccharide/polyol phosphate export permease
MVPPPYDEILLLNPLLNFLELIRGHYFAAFEPQGASYLYIIAWTMGSNLLGLWLYTHLKDRIVATS